MGITLRPGVCYVTAGGEKVGPMCPSSFGYLGERNGKRRAWSIDGGKRYSNVPSDHIVSEWSEGPVRTVTRREVVPGIYDKVVVRDVIDGKRVLVRFDRDKNDNADLVSMSANELRSAAMVLSQIAEAMDDGESK